MDFPLLVDMAIHTLDQARYLSAADPVSVYCHSFNPKRSWYKGDASVILIFEMTGGIVFTYRGSWCAQGLGTTWESSWRIICNRGTLLWDGAGTIKAQTLKPTGAEEPKFWKDMEDVPVPVTPMEHTARQGVIREFADCVRSGGVPMTDCRDNIKSLAMVLAAVESARTGGRVPVQW